MKKYIETLVKAFISFVFLMFFIIASWSLIVAMITTLDKSLSNSDKTLVLAIISAIVSIITVYITKSFERNSVQFSETKKELQPRYEAFLQDVLYETADRKVLQKKYEPFLASHASDIVYNAFIRYCNDTELKPDEFVTAIRMELKLTNKKSNSTSTTARNKK